MNVPYAPENVLEHPHGIEEGAFLHGERGKQEIAQRMVRRDGKPPLKAAGRSAEAYSICSTFICRKPAVIP